MIDEGWLVVTLIVFLLFGRQVFGLLDVEQAVHPQERELHHFDVALFITNDLTVFVVRLLAHRFVQHREG
ncbi:hypothetical protein D3C81_1829990 [compost metagenome]